MADQWKIFISSLKHLYIKSQTGLEIYEKWTNFGLSGIKLMQML